MTKSTHRIVFAIIAFIALSLGLWFQNHVAIKNAQSFALKQATYLNQGRPFPPFQLKRTDGLDLNPSALVGHWTILFFGYTQCRSICPTTMAMLHQTYDILRQKEVALPDMIMISLDGERDSQDTMRQYVKAFDPAFIGATGNMTTVQKLSQILGIVYDAKMSQDGQIDHSGSLTVINPMGEVVAFFTPPMQAKDVALDLETLIQHIKLS